MVVSHGESGRGGLTQEDNAADAVRFARGDPERRRGRNVGALEEEAGEGGVRGVVGCAFMTDLLEEVGRTEKAGQAEKALHETEKDQRGEDREGELGGGTVEAHHGIGQLTCERAVRQGAEAARSFQFSVYGVRPEQG
jgi:hypothetical protein